jgi:acyl carrier protein
MTDIRSQIVETFNQVAQKQGRELSKLTDNLQLLESGLDSLCFAIVITRLEDSLGVDPFTAEHAIFPVTFGEFVSCYESVER